MNLFQDTFYSKEYASLYVKDKGQLWLFEYEDKDRKLINVAIKRPFGDYFDLETPYGYGGFLTRSRESDFIGRAMDAYEKRCKEEGIFAEFIRFHPYNPFPVWFPGQLTMCIREREVVTVNLAQTTAERWQRYGSTTRNVLRKALRNLSCEQTENVKEFKAMYEETMTRNHAGDFYFFNLNYFESLLKIPGVELWKVSHEQKTVSMGFFIFGDGMSYYHLSANDDSALKLNANYVLLEHMFERAKSRGCPIFFLGGGRTPEPADSLLLFKKKFSPVTADFYIGGKIWQDDIYREYVRIWEQEHPGDQRRYFLKYRL